MQTKEFAEKKSRDSTDQHVQALLKVGRASLSSESSLHLKRRSKPASMAKEVVLCAGKNSEWTASLSSLWTCG